jgi:hypothetical protein
MGGTGDIALSSGALSEGAYLRAAVLEEVLLARDFFRAAVFEDSPDFAFEVRFPVRHFTIAFSETWHRNRPR